MPKCVRCGKEMNMGFIILEGNKVHCPKCADEHPQVIAAKERSRKMRAVSKLAALAAWKNIAGDRDRVEIDGVTITKEEFIEMWGRRSHVA